MNTAESTDTLIDIGLDVDLDKEPECEGRLHPTSGDGHDGGPAKWLLRQHCGGGHIQLCEGRRRTLLDSVLVKCDRCAAIVISTELVFIEL